MATAKGGADTAGAGSSESETGLDETAFDLAREGFKLLLESIEKTDERVPSPVDMEERAAKFQAALEALEKKGPSSKERAFAKQRRFEKENEPSGIGPGQIAPSSNGLGATEVELLPWRKGVESKDQGMPPWQAHDVGHGAKAATRPKARARPGLAAGAIGPGLGESARRSAAEATRIHHPDLRDRGTGSAGFGDGIEKLRSDMNRNHTQVMGAITHKNFSRP